MAITHKLLTSQFIRGYGIADIGKMYHIPVMLVEFAIRKNLRRDVYVQPEQITIADKEQITIAEVYGVITI